MVHSRAGGRDGPDQAAASQPVHQLLDPGFGLRPTGQNRGPGSRGPCFPTRRLAMDPNRLTSKSSEALQGAQAKATRLGHTDVDGEHLLDALLGQSDGLVPRLLTQSGVDPDSLAADLASELAQRPKVSGPGVPP